MGLLDKAKEAAEHAGDRARSAAEQAAERASGLADRASSQVQTQVQGDAFRSAAGQARVAAGQLGKATSEAVSNAASAVSDPTNQAHAREAATRGLKRAKSGVVSMLDRIDPGLLADVVIKATSLQESANRRLRAKHSPYRINEITITAGLPPDVAFTIGRIEVEEEDLPPEAESAASLDAEEDTDGRAALGDPADAGLIDPDLVAGGDLAEASAVAPAPANPLEPEVGVPVMDPAGRSVEARWAVVRR